MSEAAASEDASITPASGVAPTRPEPPRGGGLRLAALFGLHLLAAVNFAILPALMPQIREAFGLKSLNAGWLSPIFLGGFAAGSLAAAYLGDRTRRSRLLAGGVALWGVAAAATGIVADADQLRLARILLGAGQGIFTVVALTQLTDVFVWHKRARALAFFMTAAPVGGLIAATFAPTVVDAIGGWRPIFLGLGLASLAAAGASLLFRDTLRGEAEGIDHARLRLHETWGASREDYIDLMVNSSYTYSVLGLAFATFALGGLGAWLPTYMFSTRDVAIASAPFWRGVATAAATAGLLLGGAAADLLSRRRPRSLFVVPALAMFGTAVGLLAVLYLRETVSFTAALVVTQMLLFAATGPALAIISNAAMPNMRAAGYGVALAAIHVLGDVWSPPLMAWVADTFSQPDAMESVFGQALAALGATPRPGPSGSPENWTAGLIVVVPALVLGGSFFLAGARHLPREMALMLAKLKASPRRAPGMGAAAASR